MLVRASTATNALFKLTPDDSVLAAEALARTIIEMTITFAWLAAAPDDNIPLWLAGTDYERRKADNKGIHWLVEANYRDEPEPLLSEELRAEVDREAAALNGLDSRAKDADTFWRPRIPELQVENCSFGEIYARAYTHYSSATHALLQPLFRFIGSHPKGGVFVGDEGKDDASSPWGIVLHVYALGLLVSAEAFGWPDAGTVRALVSQG